MGNKKPFVAVACVCDQVIIGADGAVSLIRLFDVLTVVTEGVPLHEAFPLKVTAFFAIRSGSVKGEHELDLVLRYPSGKRGETRKWPVVLNGGEHGANLRVQVSIASTEVGIYWFDLLWKGEPLTSVPFKVLRQVSASPSENS